MKVIIHHLRRQDAYIPRGTRPSGPACPESPVHYLRKLLDRHVAVPVKTRALPEGVHSRVRAARPVDVDVLHGDVLQDMLYLALHSPRLRLLLPAGEVRSVIFDFDQYILAHFVYR